MRPEQLVIYRHLAHALRGRRVVDVGCGIGIGTNVLAYWGCQVVGTDIEPGHVGFARAIYPELSFAVWDICRGPIVLAGGGRADAAVAVEVIEHVEAAEAVTRHLLASAPRVYLSTPNRANPMLGQESPLNQFHVREYTPAEVLDLLGRPATIRDPFSWRVVGSESLMTPLVYEVGDAR